MVAGGASKAYGGGGATHIANISGKLYDLEAYKGEYSSQEGTYKSENILMVAGGGGGTGKSGKGGDAGGYVGIKGSAGTANKGGNGGSQSSGGSVFETQWASVGSFGKGGDASKTPSNSYNGGRWRSWIFRRRLCNKWK